MAAGAPMHRFLGVDGGGTKTHVVVADASGAVVGFGTNGPSNWEMVGLVGAGTALALPIEAALAEAGAEPADVTASAFGLAGVDWPSDHVRLGGVIDRLRLGGPRALVNDAFIALRAGTARPYGVVVVAGTGTVAAGRNRDGEVFRTLGLGPEFGDWGSASDVGIEALRAVANAFTGRGSPTALTAALCDVAGVSDVEDLLEHASRDGAGFRREELEDPRLAPLVIRASDDGDAVARDILDRTGAMLGESAALVARRLRMLDDRFDVVLAGGLFRGGSRPLEDALEVSLRRQVHAAHLVKLDAPPVVGAAIMAMELTGIEPTFEVCRRLASEVTASLAERHR
jgi:N-acetylglucosamine kinase-like BadF-type ATPase